MTRPHRVLLVEANEDGTAGGSHQGIFDLATRVDRTIFEPSVLFYQHTRFVELLTDAGIPVRTWERQRGIERQRRPHASLLRKANTGWKLIGAIRRRAQLIRELQPDLVHLNNSPCIGFDDWLPAARLARLPITCHLRGPFVRVGSSVGQWLTRQFDAYVAVSRHVADDLIQNSVPPDRVHLIYNGIDLKRWQSHPEESVQTRKRHGVPDGVLLVILVGLIRSWKGQLVAVRALRQLSSDERASIRLWIVGGVSEEEAAYDRELRQEVAQARLEDTVTFFGHRTDVPSLMDAADVVLHTSTVPEPFGRVVLEGLALGKTVVASQLGGPSEILGPGDGLLFDPASPETLAVILRDLAHDQAARIAFGRRAAIRAQAFDVQSNVDSVARLWSGLVNGRR